jgi:hypothetical protein
MKLGMFALLKKNFEGDLKTPIFDKYWDFSYPINTVNIVNVKSASDEEEKEIITNKNSNATLHRVQNFSINL